MAIRTGSPERQVVGSPRLGMEIRRRLGPPPDQPEWPLVSVIVLNHDGAGLLRRMLAGLVECTDYSNLELIVVDNGSSDDSLDFIRTVATPFPISIVANPHNESFSDGCNQGAELARGELLLFLNNDIEPFEAGWLRELVACLCGTPAGAVAATLVCLDEEHEASFEHGFGVQHRGLAFREEGGMIHPVLHGWEADPLDEHLGKDAERPAVAAACVLVERGAYERVEGFSHGYVYGAEDIDLCLKLRTAGFRVLCSGRSIAIHHPVSTRRAAPFEEQRACKLANRRVLWERWGPQLRREYELDRLGGGGLWAEAGGAGSGGEGANGLRSAAAEVEALGFCIKAVDPRAAKDLDGVAAALGARGHRCLLLKGEHAEDLEGLNYDIAVHPWGRIRHLPKPAQLNVLWDAGGAAAPGKIERSRYDLVLGGSERSDRFAEDLLAAVEDCIPRVGFRARVDGRKSIRGATTALGESPADTGRGRHG